MIRFRKLIYLILASGTIAGLLLFAVQHLTIYPLIERAEVYESAAEKASLHHHDEGWQPADGLERNSLTLLATVATAFGFSAVLFGLANLLSAQLTWRNGILWGLAAYLCINLAPALGLPPQPPGTPVADLHARQLWWIFTVVSTAVALWLLLDKRRPAVVRVLGVVLAILPHAIGAPRAIGESVVPLSLIHDFAFLSLVTTGFFWIVLGAAGGLIDSRFLHIESQP